MNILLVDDSPSERLLLQSLLKRLGHQVIPAGNGEEGLARFCENRPDLVLLDVVMPVLDGYATATRMRAVDDDWIPIIFLSGRVDASDVARGIECGGDDYLCKPCDPVVLAAKVRSMERIAAMRSKLLHATAQLALANSALAKAANVDGLTGVGNRHALDATLAREASRAMRQRAPLSVVLVDVDHFKLYNDRYGHLAGDECLRQVARAIGHALKRPADFVARYGGEEFCMVLPDTPATGALHVAEKARCAIEALALPSGVDLRCVTASLGAATRAGDSAVDRNGFLGEADAALYAAKHAGRNRALHSMALDAVRTSQALSTA